MNYTDAQNLLGVPRYVSQVELRKKYIALIEIHHPDVNADKKRANKLTSDIIEAYEVFLKHRDQEKWKEKDTETKTANGSFGNNKNANHRSQPEENYGIWEKQSKQTPLSKIYSGNQLSSPILIYLRRTGLLLLSQVAHP